jgi:uracil-DNA glycosylase
MRRLLSEIRSCTLCEAHLPNAPRPVLAAEAGSRIVLIGQAPGRVVQETGIPWSDQSGRELRRWLGVDEATFYAPANFALIPMGFCYPGTGKSGDLPPRPECAAHWHARLIRGMKGARLFLLVGTYAQRHYLGGACGATVTDTVRGFRGYLPRYLPLVHPSPRNKIWHKRNPWFEADVVPELRRRVRMALEAKP